MAESANPSKAPVAPVPAPVPAETAVPEVQKPKSESKLFKYISRFLTSTTWLVFGLFFLSLGVLEHKIRFSQKLPQYFQIPLAHFIPHLPYFFAGIGLIFIGHVRSLLRQDYSAAFKKDRKFPHAWKISLIAAQVFILQGIGFYAISIGFAWLPILQNLVGLIFILLIFMAYVLWYVVSDLMSHFPSSASYVVALIGFSLAGISLLTWTGQLIFVSLVFGLFAVISAISSISIASSKQVEQRDSWARYIGIAATVGILAYVGYNGSQIGKTHMNLVGLGLASKDPSGEIVAMAYSPDNKKVAFSLKTKEGWYLQIIDSTSQKSTFKISAGEDYFRPIFIEDGKSLMLDVVKGGERGLWKVNAETGAILIIKRQGVQAFGNSIHWSDKTNQFLYVLRTESKYLLNAYPEPKGKQKPIFSSNEPILYPSWTFNPEEVSYVDGTHGYFFVLDLKTGKLNPVLSDQEKAEGQKFENLPVKEVIPAPDGFRFLYLVDKDKSTSLWSVLSDGTKRKSIYVTKSKLQHLAWFPDGQKVIFEEEKRQFGFLMKTRTIRVLDANLDTVDNLIPPQIEHWSPAISPNGVKVAFAGDQGLWYRTFNTGVWVAVLR